METIGGNGSKGGLIKKKGKHKSTTGISASIIPDYREKEESKIQRSDTADTPPGTTCHFHRSSRPF